MKRQNLLFGIAFVLIGTSLVGCGEKGGSSVSSLPGSSTSSPSTSLSANNALKAALEKDYSNMTVGVTSVYDLFGDGNLMEEYFTEYYYNGYTIIPDETSEAEFRYDLYYHDYNGESYLYFPDSYGRGDGWLKEGKNQAPLGLHNTYFDFDYSLEHLDPDTAVYSAGSYVIADQEAVAELNSTMFYFAWFNNIEYVVINVSDGYLHSIFGFGSLDNDDEYVAIRFGQIGTTMYQDSLLPEAPTASSVRTWHDYSGEEIIPDKYIESINVKTEGEVASDDTHDIILDIEKLAEVSMSYLPTDANKYKDVSWHSSDEDVAIIESHMTSGHRYVKGQGAGEAEIYATARGENGTTITSNKIKVKVLPLPEQNLEGVVYNFDIVSCDNEVVTANNKVETTASHSITGNKIVLRDGEVSAAFEPGRQILGIDPLSTDFSKPAGAEVVFDFADQQVSSISMYYGLLYSGHKSYLDKIKSAKIMTSNDGENWEEIDILAEVKENISYENKKLMEKSFAPASMVKIRLEASMVGNQFIFAMDNLAFMASEDCKDHVDFIEIPVTDVTISASATSLKIDDKVTFGAVFGPSDANVGKALSWHSTNSDVLSVNESGVGTALSAGSSEVYAVSENGVESNKLTINVEARPTLPTAALGVYKYTDFLDEYTLTISDVNSATLTHNESSWTLKVDSLDDDYYTLLNDNDEEYLKIKYSSYYDQIDVFALLGDIELGNKFTNTGAEFVRYVEATSIKVTANKTEILIGEKTSVYASVQPSDAYYKELDRTVSDTTIGDFEDDESNYFVGKTAGEVTITYVNAEGVEGSVTITVVAPKTITSMSIIGKESIEVDESSEYTLAINPSDYNSSKFNWSVEDTSVAKVVKNGDTSVVTIKGVSAGSTTITCTDQVSGVSTTFTINVTEASSKLPDDMLGDWYLSDIVGYGETHTFTFEADGSLTWCDDLMGYEVSLSLDSIDGNTYTFIGSYDDLLVFEFDNGTLTLIEMNDAQGMYYLESSMELSK